MMAENSPKNTSRLSAHHITLNSLASSMIQLDPTLTPSPTEQEIRYSAWNLRVTLRVWISTGTKLKSSIFRRCHQQVKITIYKLILSVHQFKGDKDRFRYHCCLWFSLCSYHIWHSSAHRVLFRKKLIYYKRESNVRLINVILKMFCQGFFANR
ncbi:hypothetical protein FGO68_gene8418 [Halteria grandinella]|uniref:Uncharacterized protein n=1 Tax=Halteria grandinella TaxID=5974 RepID=A0A8J8T373_HALGN|nr:hypothetical protein FGO68_gene8418 [Halteria grandinella]